MQLTHEYIVPVSKCGVYISSFKFQHHEWESYVGTALSAIAGMESNALVATCTSLYVCVYAICTLRK